MALRLIVQPTLPRFLNLELLNNARKPPVPTTIEPTPPVQTEIALTAAQAKDLQQINDRVGKVTTAKSKKLLDLDLIVQIGEDLVLTKQGETVLAKHQT